MQPVFFAKFSDLRHHFTFVMQIERSLVLPAIDQQHRLRILHREKVFVLKIAIFGADFLYKTANGHFFGKLACAAVFAGVIQMNGKSHEHSSDQSVL